MQNIPKKMKLMTDYGSWCLWDMEDAGDVNPDGLPISPALKEKLRQWSARYDETLDLEDHTKIGFKSDLEYQTFYEDGWSLFDWLKRELPQVELWYFDERIGRPVQVRR